MIDLTTPQARRYEVLGAGAFFLLIGIGTLWYMATHPAPVAAPTVEETATTTPPLPPQTIEEHAQYYDIEATYPAETPLKDRLGARADLAAIASMKTFIETSVSEFKTQGNFENLTPEDLEIMGLLDGRRESLMIDYEEIQGKATVSYVFTLFVDTLGAHPNGFYRTFTFDMATGKELALRDLFVPGSDYLRRLSAITRFELPKKIGEFADIDYINQGTTPEEVNFASFSVTETSLIIIFAPYQVGPYAIGTQTVEIPLTQLSEILRPAYRP